MNMENCNFTVFSLQQLYWRKNKYFKVGDHSSVSNVFGTARKTRLEWGELIRRSNGGSLSFAGISAGLFSYTNSNTELAQILFAMCSTLWDLPKALEDIQMKGVHAEFLADCGIIMSQTCTDCLHNSWAPAPSVPCCPQTMTSGGQQRAQRQL
ncbi:hypothetical protein BaRGS_00001282 [Batillaria attramentaria]|uniref:Uncharacterized protein n=1 Tax=Batillaria attramentaria TaxID=370345 RepID=A0ABD0M6R4_9CAEN